MFYGLLVSPNGKDYFYSATKDGKTLLIENKCIEKKQTLTEKLNSSKKNLENSIYKNYIPKIDQIIEKSLEEKLKNILEKINNIDLDNSKLAKYKDLFKYFEFKIIIELETLEKRKKYLIKKTEELGIYGIVEILKSKDYDKLLEKVINNILLFENEDDYNDFIEKKGKIILDNKNIYIDLLKEDKLPIIEKVIVGGNEIFITSSFLIKDYDKLFDCKYWSKGELNRPNCITIIKRGNKYEVQKLDFFKIAYDMFNIKTINNKYIISDNGKIDGLISTKRLFDKDLILLNTIKIVSNYDKNNTYNYFINGKEISFDHKYQFNTEKNLISSYENGEITLTIGKKEFLYKVSDLLK